MHRRHAAATVVALTILALTGCVPTTGALAVRPGTGANNDALLRGIVRISDACVWVEADGAAYIPVFEVGDAWLEGGDTLVYGGGRHADGDEVLISGGIAPEPAADWYVPSGCPRGGALGCRSRAPSLEVRDAFFSARRTARHEVAKGLLDRLG